MTEDIPPEIYLRGWRYVKADEQREVRAKRWADEITKLQRATDGNYHTPHCLISDEFRLNLIAFLRGE